MVYLKNAAIEPNDIQPDQLAVLNEFKSWLGTHGVLYKVFRNTVEFENTLQIELSIVMRSFSVNDGLAENNLDVVTSEASCAAAAAGDQDELGLLDYLDIQENSFSTLSDLLAEQTLSLGRMTERTQANREELNRLGSSGIEKSAFRRILKRGAEIWDNYSDDAEKRILKLERATEEGFSAMANAISLRSSSKEKGSNTIRADVLNLINAVKGTKSSIGLMKNSIENFPKLTVESNRSKKRLIGVLQRNLEHYETTLRLANAVLEAVPPDNSGD